VLSAGTPAKTVFAGHGTAPTAPTAPNAPTDPTYSTAATASTAADLHGEIAELHTENERLKRMVHDLEAETLNRRQKRMRPDLLRGTTRRVETPLGTLYVTITEDDKGQPFEVFMSLGKAGGALMADVEALGRLISLSLRSGIPMKEVHRQLRGISSDRVIGLGVNKVLSVPDAVGIAIEKWMIEKQGIQQELLPGGAGGSGTAQTASTALSALDTPVITRVTAGGAEQMKLEGMPMLTGACPDCGSQLEFAEGCVKCHVCGYSECG
jgi:ribonucleoside-diphosphate reductase alpha chain